MHTRMARSLPRAVRLQVFERDDYTCRYCGTRIEQLRVWSEFLRRWFGLIHVDHVIPRSKGGADDLENLVTSCQPCNLAKYDHVWEPLPLPTPWERAHRVWLRTRAT